MRKQITTIAALLIAGLSASNGLCDAAKGEKIDGKMGFDKHCAVCHPNGGNNINAQKPLTRKSMAANGVKSAKDVVGKMRNPGPGMNKFDKKTVSDKEAKAIAEYILKAFK